MTGHAIALRVAPSFTAAMVESIRSLCEVGADRVGEVVELGFSRAELADRLDDFDRLVSVKTVAFGAGVIEVQVLPSEQYLELVAAFTVDGLAKVAMLHGWPILLSLDEGPTIVGHGDAATVSSEGKLA